MKKYLLRRLGVAQDPGQIKPSLQTCIEAVLDQSDALMDDVLSGLQVSLSPANSKSLHARQNPVRRVTVELLVQRQADLKFVFAKSLRAAVYGGETQRRVSPARVKFDDFQFLEDEQIDANIELALTEQEVTTAVEDVLPTLNGYISSLLGWSSVQPHLNPIKPEAFVFSLREALGQLVPEDEARGAVMTLAAGLLGAALHQLYRELTDWLRSQGVEPVASATSSTGPFGGHVKMAENSVTRTLLTLDKLRRLLSGELDPSGAARGIKDFTHTVPASFLALEDMKLVEPMMKRLAERANLLGQTAPKGKTPGKALTKDGVPGKVLGQQLGEEVVRLMLENLMHDRRLLASVRQGLKSMEFILIRLSQSDRRFFSEKKHPARLFLDKITNRSLAFTSEDEPGFSRFQKTFDNSLSVLTGGEGDAHAFARLLRKLEDGWAVDEKVQRARAEEAARGLLHAEQRNLLAERFTKDFTERLTRKTVPELVVKFLQGPWAQVVAESQLRCADGRQDADGYLALVDDLVWSVRLRLARRNRSRLVELVPQMLVKIRQGLKLIEYPEDRIPVFFDGLIAIHEQVFESARVVSLEVGAGSTEVVVHDADEDDEAAAPEADGFWMAESEATDSGFLRDGFEPPPSLPEVAEVADRALQSAWGADNLQTGSWVDLALGGQWVRAQLTWASPHRTLFMFISSGGLAHSMSRRTMDRLRGLGLIRLVSDGHVMDNALDAVAQAALRNDLGNAGNAG